jgi:hypothetical protein
MAKSKTPTGCRYVVKEGSRTVHKNTSLKQAREFARKGAYRRRIYRQCEKPIADCFPKDDARRAAVCIPLKAKKGRL